MSLPTNGRLIAGVLAGQPPTPLEQVEPRGIEPRFAECDSAVMPPTEADYYNHNLPDPPSLHPSIPPSSLPAPSIHGIREALADVAAAIQICTVDLLDAMTQARQLERIELFKQIQNFRLEMLQLDSRLTSLMPAASQGGN